MGTKRTRDEGTVRVATSPWADAPKSRGVRILRETDLMHPDPDRVFRLRCPDTQAPRRVQRLQPPWRREKFGASCV